MQFEIKRCSISEWGKFRRYHYLNTAISSASQCYGLYDKEKIIGFLGVIHFPHPKRKIKRVTRLVILPDYQGIGLGIRFLEAIAKIYCKKVDFRIVTTAKNLIYALNKRKNWKLTRYSRHIKMKKKSKNKEINKMNESLRTNVKTASFIYLEKE